MISSGGYMIVCKKTNQIRSIQGALMFDTPHNAKKALKRDCKRCGENYEDTLDQYDIVDFIATEFAAGVLINNERYSLHRIKLSKKDLKALSNGGTLMYNNLDVKNLITLEVEND